MSYTQSEMIPFYQCTCFFCSPELCTFFSLFVTHCIFMTHHSNSWKTVPSHSVARTQLNNCTGLQYNMHMCTQHDTPFPLPCVSSRMWVTPKRFLRSSMFGFRALFTHWHCSFLDGENCFSFVHIWQLPHIIIRGTQTMLRGHCWENSPEPQWPQQHTETSKHSPLRCVETKPHPHTNIVPRHKRVPWDAHYNIA